MSRISTSIKVKERINVLLKKLIRATDPSLPEHEALSDAFKCQWDESALPDHKLMIRTKLKFLVALINSENDTLLDSNPSLAKEQVREALRVLASRINILEDNRVRTQGSNLWEFKLVLWHRSVEKNLEAFDQAWQTYKASQKRRRSSSSSSDD
jgi:Effector-associated domain 4